MLASNSDLRVLGFLGRALSLELSAVQQYSTQARLVKAWGLTEVAGKLSNEVQEELAHVDRIIGRMLALGVAPNASHLRPVVLGQNLLELLQNDYAFEKDMIAFYSDATQYCATAGDHDSRLFFEALLNEEKSHSQELQQWIQDIQQST